MVTEELDLQPDFVRDVGAWLGAGRLRFQETVVDGLENTMEAYHALMRGESVGKMVVKR
jgi:NADPH-dependent curcumin reductase CurA